jgi:hypothetical protein
MSYDRAQLVAALRKADAAGDVAAARAIAKRLQAPAPSYVDPDGDFSPTEGQSFLTNAAAGAGKSVVDTWEGAKQLFGFGDQAAIDERARLDKPLMQTGGGLTGNVVGQIGQMAIPGAALGKLGLAAKTAGTLGKVAASAAGAGAFAGLQPVTTGGSRAENTVKGAALGAVGQGVASGLGRLAKGGKDSLEPAVRELALKAESYGIPVSLAQLSNSRFVRGLKSVVDKLPFSGSAKLNDAQQRAFNRAVGRTFGADSDRITTDVAAAAKKRLGNEFTALSARSSVKFDTGLLDDLAKIQDDAAKTGTADNARAVSNVVDELLDKSKNGVIPGPAYRQMDSRIGKLIKTTTDGDKRHYLGQVRDAVRDAMERSVPASEAKAWKAARGKYRNMKTVEDLMEKAVDGNLSPALLLQVVRSANKDLAYGGGGELADLARIGQRFLKDPIPNSGTPERLMALGGLGGVGMIEPTALATMLATGRGVGSALNTPASGRYMLQGSPALGRLTQGAQPLPYLLPAIANAQQ